MQDFNKLILLVGTNPLPNFVVAEYFLRNNHSLNEIIFLYSEENQYQRGTREYAENLQKLLQGRHKNINLNFRSIHLSDISSAKEIERNLEERLTSHLENSHSIHLNYTGGTKVMATHIYRWIENYAKRNKITASFSYLDARKFQIVDDAQERITDDLRKEIGLNLEELIKLHGFERKNEPSDDDLNLFNNAIEKFKELIDNGSIGTYLKNYSEYRQKIFTDEKGNLIRKTKELKSRIKENIAQGVLLDVIKSMPDEYKLFNDDGSFKELKTNKHTEKAIEFLDGKWLELYVYKVLTEKISDKNIALYNNWEIKKPEWQSPNQKFELDIILIKGYQLIGISCTTSDRKFLCKSKGFEIFTRTRQIGGEEARAVLITMLPDPKDLQGELEVDTGGKENILVLGANDLKEDVLVGTICEFIK
jgi:hypothetical protein